MTLDCRWYNGHFDGCFRVNISLFASMKIKGYFFFFFC